MAEYFSPGVYVEEYDNSPRSIEGVGTSTAGFIGFTEKSFYSADYFSLFPWLFLYLTGYFGYEVAKQKGALEKLAELKSWGKFLNLVGKKSLIIYMLHQPVVYGILFVLDKVGLL